MNEKALHITAIFIFLSGAAISIYYRRKADRESGEKISPRAEGLPIMIGLRVFGLALWLGVFAYLINPNWMSWSQLALPAWVRWLGAGLGIFADLLAYWVFSNLGTNVSPTVATRKRHQLVTSGPYRWVRHPLYSMGMLSYLSFALLAANWYIALLAIITFIILLLRLPKEEAGLIERFGDEYRDYMLRTGRFLPKWDEFTIEVQPPRST
jgi:protein-S-isoprenylcysteine O-methyltransferase Ste14